MLERIDLNRIQRVLGARGYQRWELYAECRTLSGTSAEDRLLSTRTAEESGLTLRVIEETGPRQWSTRRLDTEGVLALISASDTPLPPEAPAAARPGHEGWGERLGALVRATWPESEGVSLHRLSIDAETRVFEVVGPGGEPRSGNEQWAGATAEWTVERDGKRLPAREELWSTRLDGFLDAWESLNPFRARSEALRRQSHPWPAPQGDVPVYWGPGAVGRLAHLFLRALEGDLVVDELSFLTQMKLPLPLGFALHEVGAEDGVDHEGESRRPLTVWQSGQPRAVACNRSVAARLNVGPTGHCRRQSFLHPPQVGFWHTRLTGDCEVGSPLGSLTWGVGVEDFEVERFDPSSGDLELRLTDARLIHQGELGEAIEALKWKTNLVDLLATLQAFGADSRPHAFPVRKKGSRWVARIDAPAALSPAVALPGVVPPSHYW